MARLKSTMDRGRVCWWYVFLAVLLGNSSTLRAQTLSPGSPSKEYIYLGGRIVAIEQPAPVIPVVAEGSSATVTISSPGSTASVSFEGTAGQRISLRINNGSISGSGWSYVTILKPDGTVLTGGWVNNWTFFFDVQTLPATGTYTILVDPENDNTGSLTLTLYGVPADASGTITPGGSPVTLSTTTPGQNASLAFSGTVGQRISLITSNGTISSTGWSYIVIKNPDSSWLNWGWVNNWTGFFDVRTLPATGSYTISMDPESLNVGSLTFTLYDVIDVTGKISIGGPSVPISITTPGQNAQLSFNGNTGQQVTLNISGALCWVYVTLKKPDGTTLTGGWVCGNGSFSGLTLPATGAYTIVVDPDGILTGSTDLTLTSP